MKLGLEAYSMACGTLVPFFQSQRATWGHVYILAAMKQQKITLIHRVCCLVSAFFRIQPVSAERLLVENQSGSHMMLVEIVVEAEIAQVSLRRAGAKSGWTQNRNCNFLTRQTEQG